MATPTLIGPTIENVRQAAKVIENVALHTPLQYNLNLSKRYVAEVLLKREDLQNVRSYKIRGAYNKLHSIPKSSLEEGIICASAGNHAQGVAYACSVLGAHGIIYMPTTTPRQKIEQVRFFGGDSVELRIVGDTFDSSYAHAIEESKRTGKQFIHPFNDMKIIEGQATVGLEIVEDVTAPIDYVFVPIGGGGLISGVSTVFKTLSPQTKIIGVEPLGAPAMKESIDQKQLVYLDQIDKFVDGAAVHQVGDLTFQITQQYVDDIVLVPEGLICQTILDMYNRDAVVVEPAGALSVAALEQYAEIIKGKRVVCIISGGNNDITRMAEIKERALLYSQLKHYFIINFPQRAGALREFVLDVLSDTDDITFFEYSKKSSRSNGPAVVGIQIEKKENLQPLIDRMKEKGFFGEYLNDKPELFQYLT